MHKSVNKINIHHRSISDLLKIHSHESFHSYLIEHAVKSYQDIRHEQGGDLGSVLAVCANYREVLSLKKFPFNQILLTGIADPDEKLRNEVANDERISYQKQNCENISLNSRSFDLVFCKEGLHHLPRPVLGLYEMLRICTRAAIIIEGYDTPLIRVLEIFNLTSAYETNTQVNICRRDNFVFRWSKRHLQLILNSYYLDSGYQLDITLGWLSGRFSLHRSKLIRYLSAVCGWGIGFIPGCYGNYLEALILPGSDIPVDSSPASRIGAC